MGKKTTIALARTVIKLTVIQVLMLIIFTSNIFAQDVSKNQTVKGTVTSPLGEPLSGVSISLKGTTIGTTTDAAGKFIINAPRKGVLIFTHIGYLKQEVPVNNQGSIDVKLDDENSELSSVVVVGYGTQRKKDLT